jgi:hypothetical protein
MNHLKLINAQKTKIIHAYENTKQKLHRTNAAIWFNKVCRSNNLIPSYIKITINTHIKLCYNTVNAAITYRINQELKFLYKEKHLHASTTYIFSASTNGPPLERRGGKKTPCRWPQ